ncbi:MAG TPA: hypothetical protein DCW29_04190, partial [Janthinobacterium sp.]|nr:hypothetical protein [Janthinobacterium sp.]
LPLGALAEAPTAGGAPPFADARFTALDMDGATLAVTSRLPAIAAAPRWHVGLGDAVGAASLEDARGGTDTVNNDARLNGMVSGNAAVNVATGNNVIDGAAFTNTAGIPIVIQNSGANVLIQNNTIVNLQLK